MHVTICKDWKHTQKSNFQHEDNISSLENVMCDEQSTMNLNNNQS